MKRDDLPRVHQPAPRWSADEDDILRREYPTSVDVFHLAERMGRTLKAVHARARRLGLKKAPGVRSDLAVRRYSEAPAPYPPCMTEKEYRDWRHSARYTGDQPMVGVCEDCTPKYAKEMRAQGRCDRPEMRFYRRVAVTWIRRADGDDEGQRVGHQLAVGHGEVYGALRPDVYSFVDASTGQSVTVRDQEAGA